MKKSFSKKLSLNKKTVVNLQDDSMQNAKGGISAAVCNTSRYICYNTCVICTLTECATACNSNPCC